MNDRIRAVRKAANLTQAEFASKIGIKPNTVTSYETGLRIPSDTVIMSICREFNVDENWLRTGEGEMFVQLSEDAEFIQILSEIEVSDDDFIKAPLRSYWRLSDNEKAAIHKLVDGMLNEKKTGD